ncbi:uncharacterized protein LOC143265784 isoform X2 [Megachile rotundata]|uniref:uncharacterized protein LOC143265784 isoform X2 n=1 Tax=Megachile rotundata TaxID=143995 RepID=UPI003FCF01CD
MVFHNPDEIEDRDTITIAVYVDDFTVIYGNSSLCDKIISRLKETFEVVETTGANTFLSIKIEQFETGIGLLQVEYIEKLLCKYKMYQCNAVATPIVPGEDKSCEKTSDLVDQELYQEIIGELLYIANRTRPDIAFVVSYLSQFNHRSEKRHMLLMKRVLRYLQGTKNKILFYSDKRGQLEIYADASWGNAEEGKSFSGGAIMLGNLLVMWRSNKQKCVGLSTCTVQLFACSEIVKDASWIINMLTEMNL